MSKATIAETPLMKQHKEIKSKYPDAVLLFRVGDFYETFDSDAVIASRVLGITLTKRANGSASSVDLAGFPHHSLDTYLHKLVKAGYRVAICDQLEDPKLTKGIVKRGVTELVTPGVATSDKLLENKTNNFLAALHLGDMLCGVAFLDITTGEFYTAEGDIEYMDKLLQSFQPSEIILSKAQVKRYREQLDSKTYTFPLEDWIYREQYPRPAAPALPDTVAQRIWNRRPACRHYSLRGDPALHQGYGTRKPAAHQCHTTHRCCRLSLDGPFHHPQPGVTAYQRRTPGAPAASAGPYAHTHGCQAAEKMAHPAALRPE